MQIIENLKIKEKLYVEKLENGLTVMIIPKSNTKKKYIMWGVNFGSIDNRFIDPKTKQEVKIPDGVAHFLEHKMFEQANGTNSLDVLSSIGVDPNAYTTNDYTTYLYECNDHFYEALDEFMNYVQNPYYTDENVEKEKGIISQEIKMYDDHPFWQVYMNAMECLYKKNPIKIDIAGTVESISEINKDTLYTCYNTFYTPSNMLMVVSGDFEPDKLINEIKKRLIKKESFTDIKRIYPEEPVEVNKKQKAVKMDVNNPLFVIAFKDKVLENKEELIKKHIAIEILLYMLIGKSSKLYQKLYKDGLIISQPDLDYEFSKQYAHITISGQSNNPEKLTEEFKKELKDLKENGIDEKIFNRIKKKIYGNYVMEFNDVSDIAKMFMGDYFKGINSFDYLENHKQVAKEYTEEILKEVFDENKMILSIVESK